MVFSLLASCGVVLASVICLISLLILYARWNYGYLEKLGIPVVKPHFILGSTFFTRFTPFGQRDIKWMKEYGSIFGVYQGRNPQIYVCDPELLRLIMVKDSTHFDSKGFVNFGDSLLNEMPDYLPGDKWKIVRGFTAPAFSSAKLRFMNFAMKKSLVEWGNQIKDAINKNGGRFERCAFDEIYFDGLTDLTLRCMFSIQEKSDKFTRILRRLANPEGLNYINLKAVGFSFPILFKFSPHTLLAPQPAKDFVQIMENLIALRKVEKSPPDVIDICIAQLKKMSTPEYKQAKITRKTILFQAFNIFFSGQDEAALVISAMIYHILCSSPELAIEEKLYQEIDRLWESLEENVEEGFDFPPREQLLQADFLEACILEGLRLYPFYHASRVCTKSWYCEKYNITIPKGTAVVIPLWAANRNPEYFANPDIFDPERFMPERKKELHSYAWSSFGHGRRNCTGKPLVMEVLKVSCAYIFKYFRFHLRPDSQLAFHPSDAWVFIGHEPIYFDITLRR